MFHNLYKHNINKNERQEIRRKVILEQQKLKRLKQQDDNRHQQEKIHNERKGKSDCKIYKNTRLEGVHLQLSEWFKEKPDNFDDWLLLPCPKGQRCLVVTEKRKTKMFSKNKRYRMTFSSLLPGGGVIGSDNDYCILDCIYNNEKDTFYVLDALHFYIPLIDCDAEFRFFWLKSKFSEINDLEEKNKCNVKSFELLGDYDISNETRLAMALQKYPLWPDNQPQLDGFLFYHKKSHYVFGTTPLVCWLFPFMLPDVLEMTVCRAYEPPANYCKQNPWQYMDEFDKMMKKRNTPIQKESALGLIEMEEDVEDLDGSIDYKYNPKEYLLTAEQMLELDEC